MSSKVFWVSRSCIAGFFAGVLCWSNVYAQADSNQLLLPATASPSLQASNNPAVTAREYVELNPAASINQPLSLQLLSEGTLTLKTERTEQVSTGGVVISGGFEETSDGSFTIAFRSSNEIAAGSFRVGSGMYELNYVGNKVHALEQIDASRFPPGAPPLLAPGSLLQQGSSAPDTTAPDPIATGQDVELDILIVYTADARLQEGGQAGMEARIDQAIALTNIGFENSNVPARLRLVHSAEVDYQEDVFGDDLRSLTSTTDGVLDEVHAMRNMFGADLVVLLRKSDPLYCGLAWVNSSSVRYSFQSLAFSVTATNCAGSNLSFAHEIGHNLGAQHDRSNANVPPLYPYSYGHILEDGSARTIMAYGRPCNFCSRLNRWSNAQQQTDLGDNWGITFNAPDSADNSLGLAGAVYTASNYRQSIEILADVCSTATPTIEGTAGPELLIGTTGNDVIFGYGGNDTIKGLAGDDIICGGSGDDIIQANSGNDFIDGGDGADELRGGADNDVIFGGSGSDMIYGAKGDDTIVGGWGNDIIYAGDGNDSVKGARNNDTIFGGAGDDYLRGSQQNDTIYGDEGNDNISGGLGNDVLSGGDGNDFLDGLQGVDVVSGDAGDDRVDGGDSTGDVLSGGSGNDVCWDVDSLDRITYSVDCEIKLQPTI